MLKEHGSSWRKARHTLGVASVTVLPTAAIALLMDLAFARRRLLAARLEQRWWGRAARGCWLAERRCMDTRGEDLVSVWQQGSDDITESQCMEAAKAIWNECVDPADGLTAASYRPTGRTLVWPEAAADDRRLQRAISVTLGGSGLLLSPIGDPWVVELCDGHACERFPVGSLCGGLDMTLGFDATSPLALCGGCRAPRDGRFARCEPWVPAHECIAKQCDFSEFFEVGCHTLCVQARRAQLLFAGAVMASVMALTVVCVSLRYGWCRHAGCMAVCSAMFGAVAVVLSLLVLGYADIAGALASGAALYRVAGWEPAVGAVEAALVAVALVAEAFVVIGVSKSRRSPRYERLDGACGGVGASLARQLRLAAAVRALDRWLGYVEVPNHDVLDSDCEAQPNPVEDAAALQRALDGAERASCASSVAWGGGAAHQRGRADPEAAAWAEKLGDPTGGADSCRWAEPRPSLVGAPAAEARGARVAPAADDAADVAVLLMDSDDATPCHRDWPPTEAPLHRAAAARGPARSAADDAEAAASAASWSGILQPGAPAGADGVAGDAALELAAALDAAEGRGASRVDRGGRWAETRGAPPAWLPVPPAAAAVAVDDADDADDAAEEAAALLAALAEATQAVPELPGALSADDVAEDAADGTAAEVAAEGAASPARLPAQREAAEALRRSTVVARGRPGEAVVTAASWSGVVQPGAPAGADGAAGDVAIEFEAALDVLEGRGVPPQPGGASPAAGSPFQSSWLSSSTSALGLSASLGSPAPPTVPAAAGAAPAASAGGDAADGAAPQGGPPVARGSGSRVVPVSPELAAPARTPKSSPSQASRPSSAWSHEEPSVRSAAAAAVAADAVATASGGVAAAPPAPPLRRRWSSSCDSVMQFEASDGGGGAEPSRPRRSSSCDPLAESKLEVLPGMTGEEAPADALEEIFARVMVAGTSSGGGSGRILPPPPPIPPPMCPPQKAGCAAPVAGQQAHQPHQPQQPQAQQAQQAQPLQRSRRHSNRSLLASVGASLSSRAAAAAPQAGAEAGSRPTTGGGGAPSSRPSTRAGSSTPSVIAVASGRGSQDGRRGQADLS